MELLKLPIMSALEAPKTILLAGAGGGYDIFTGLPLYFALKNAGKTVHLANLSFAPIYASSGKRRGTAIVEIDGSIEDEMRYFPELYLAQWLKQRREPSTIYCIDRAGAAPVAAAYRYLNETLKPDAIVLIDGGTDSLMRGDEPKLGTPQEDIASLAAVHALDVPTKLLICLGFGIDNFHGVCHHYVLEAIAELIKADGYLGAWSLTKDMPEVKLYAETCEFVFRKMFNDPSIVNSSILSAIAGEFGNHHATYRTQGSTLYINALMSIYWCFTVDAVANRNLYLDRIADTRLYEELTMEIEKFRCSLPARQLWMDLPL
jgi:hypothetical protein